MKFRLYWLGPATPADGPALGEWAIDQGAATPVWRVFSFAVMHGAWSAAAMDPAVTRPRGWIEFLEFAVLADGVPVSDQVYQSHAKPLV